MTLVMSVILVLALTFAHSVLASNIDEGYFRLLQNMRIESKSAPYVLLRNSETKCSMACKQYMSCCIASYKQSTTECLLYIADSCNYKPDAADSRTVLAKDVRCALPPAVSNATFTVNKVVSADEVRIKYACNHGYNHVSGDLVRECIQGPPWSGKAPVCKKCPADWLFHGTSCYKIFTTSLKNWQDAQTECQRIGSKLVEIETREEGLFVRQVSMKTKKSYLWLGGTMMDTGYWHWATSGKRFTYTDWAQGEPSRKPLEVCLNILNNTLTNYRWNDAENSHKSPYICENSIMGLQYMILKSSIRRVKLSFIGSTALITFFRLFGLRNQPSSEKPVIKDGRSPVIT